MDAVKTFGQLLEELTQAVDDDAHQGTGGVASATKAVAERFELVVQLFRGAMAAGRFSEVAHATVMLRMLELGLDMPPSALADAAPLMQPTSTEVARSHVVRTCCAIVDDVEPHGLPTIPKGTYGIDISGDGAEYARVNFMTSAEITRTAKIVRERLPWALIAPDVGAFLERHGSAS
jgi:hypothetical protein